MDLRTPPLRRNECTLHVYDTSVALSSISENITDHKWQTAGSILSFLPFRLSIPSIASAAQLRLNSVWHQHGIVHYTQGRRAWSRFTGRSFVLPCFLVIVTVFYQHHIPVESSDFELCSPDTLQSSQRSTEFVDHLSAAPRAGSLRRTGLPKAFRKDSAPPRTLLLRALDASLRSLHELEKKTQNRGRSCR